MFKTIKDKFIEVFIEKIWGKLAMYVGFSSISGWFASKSHIFADPLIIWICIMLGFFISVWSVVGLQSIKGKDKRFNKAFFKFKLAPRKNGAGIIIEEIDSENITLYPVLHYDSNFDNKGNKKIRILLETRQKMINIKHSVCAIDNDSDIAIYQQGTLKGNYFIILELVGNIQTDNRVYEITLRNSDK